MSSSSSLVHSYQEVNGSLIDVNQYDKLHSLEKYLESTVKKLYREVRSTIGPEAVQGMYSPEAPPGGRYVVPLAVALVPGDTAAASAAKKEAKAVYMETEKDQGTLATLLAGAFTTDMKSIMFEHGGINGATPLEIMNAYRARAAAAGPEAVTSAITARMAHQIRPNETHDTESYFTQRDSDIRTMAAAGEPIGNLAQIATIELNFSQDPHLKKLFIDSKERVGLNATAAVLKAAILSLSLTRPRPPPHVAKAAAVEANKKTTKVLSKKELIKLINTFCHVHGHGCGHNSEHCKAMAKDPSLMDEEASTRTSQLYKANKNLVEHSKVKTITHSTRKASDGGGKAPVKPNYNGKAAGGAHAAIDEEEEDEWEED